MIRVYNKTKEILKFPKKNYITDLWATNENYNPSKEVYRIEFQLRREKLKNMVIGGEVLDGFEVILNNINNIWNKCLDDFSLRDFDNENALELLLGYKVLKNGTEKPITAYTRSQRFKRSQINALWLLIKSFNGYKATLPIDKLLKPCNSSELYISNALKSVISTCINQHGFINSYILEDCFNKANDYNIKKHGVSLFEHSLNKKLDTFRSEERRVGKECRL